MPAHPSMKLQKVQYSTAAGKSLGSGRFLCGVGGMRGEGLR